MEHSPPVLRSSLREAWITAALWVAACAWTVGYCALAAYPAGDGAAPRLLFGMPTWVVWGIVAPWAVCLLFTCWFAGFGLRDEELGGEDAVAAAEEGLA